MMKRIEQLESVFEWIISPKLNETYPRLLDHGIVSGCLILQIFTLYYRMIYLHHRMISRGDVTFFVRVLVEWILVKREKSKKN